MFAVGGVEGNRMLNADADSRVLGLRPLSLAAVGACVSDDLQDAESQMLRRYLLQAGGTQATWASCVYQQLQAPSDQDVPLIELAVELGLSPLEILTAALAVSVEEDSLSGRAVARVQAPVGGSRPTLGLVDAALAPLLAPGERAVDALVSGPAVQTGLLEVAETDVPLPERTVRVPLHLFLALNGRDGSFPQATIGVAGVAAQAEVKLPGSMSEEVSRRAGMLRASPQNLLVLRSGSRLEGRSVAAAIAASLGSRAVFIDTNNVRGLVPWLVLRGLLPVFLCDLGPGERRVLPGLAGYDGPVLALGGPEGSVETEYGVATNWTIPVPDADERRLLWRESLPDTELADRLAREHRHGIGRISQLGQQSRVQSQLQGRESPTMDDVLAASWSVEGGGLGSLAQPLPDRVPNEALVVAEPLRKSLDALLLRCRVRDGLVAGLGVSATSRYRPGVRSLLVGPSGTGKTLAAGWLAGQLGLPLFRVDLASVVSKYIGETEKNLAQLLARAEQAEVVLLFDEADSLFGKRTEVQQANDRFANAQTNYLLQRIETWDGIALLTSNSRNRFDDAFTRRLDMILEFPSPGPKERRKLWRSHLGDSHAVSHQQLNRLAATSDLTGGQIRNVVLAAAVIAGSEERAMTYEDIAAGLTAEYRKAGRQVPGELKAG